MVRTITLLGSGAWGTALAMMLTRSGHQVHIYARNRHIIDYVSQHRAHPLFPDCLWPPTLQIAHGPAIFEAADVVFSVIPVQATPQTLASFPIPARTPVILCSKGLCQPDGILLSEAVRQHNPQPLSVLSGPSFAHEVMHQCLTSVVLAAESLELGSQLISLFQDPSFTVFQSQDMIGVQLAGALKNVLAIASGIILGGGYGENARANLMTRGLEELAALGVKLGGQHDTFYGLAGLGDIFLTATSMHSRNFCLGQKLATGESFNGLAEGQHTAATLQTLIQKSGLSLPILTTISGMIQGTIPINHGIKVLQ